MNFESARGNPDAEGHGAAVRRQGNDPDRALRPRRSQAQAGGARRSRRPRPRRWASTGYDVPGGIRRSGTGPDRQGNRLERTGAAASPAATRGVRHLRSRMSARSSTTSTRNRRRNTCCRRSAANYKWCLAQTEPDAGGDPGGMRTTAVRQGDHYVVNGMKRFITGADEADFTQLIAATDRSKGSRGGISAFVVDMKAPGVKLMRAAGTGDRRPAVGDRVRQRQGAGRGPHRRGRRRLQARAELDQPGPRCATARAASA